jgi:hypothetical protein
MEDLHMEHRLGGYNRFARLAGAGMSFTCAVMAPLPLAARVAAFGSMGVYMMYSALRGSCYLSRLFGGSAARGSGR